MEENKELDIVELQQEADPIDGQDGVLSDTQEVVADVADPDHDSLADADNMKIIDEQTETEIQAETEPQEVEALNPQTRKKILYISVTALVVVLVASFAGAISKGYIIFQNPNPIPTVIAKVSMQPTSSLPPTSSPLPTASPVPTPTSNPVNAVGDADIYKRFVNHDGNRMAYLTFDDGPSPNVTPIILETLKDKGIHATFFVTGANAKAYPNLIKQEFEGGNVVANHTWSHVYKTVYGGNENFDNEVTRTQDVLKEILGAENVFMLFRFPGGSYGKKTVPYKEEIAKLGYKYVDWNALSWSEIQAENEPDRVDGAIRHYADTHEDLIILMHDPSAKMVTADTLPYVIKTLKELGFGFGVIKP